MEEEEEDSFDDSNFMDENEELAAFEQAGLEHYGIVKSDEDAVVEEAADETHEEDV